MKDIVTKINESLQMEWIKDLEDIACNMFNKYDSTWNIDEIEPWARGKEDPTNGEFEEMIDDILSYCEEENVKLQSNFKKSLENFKDLDDEDQDDIKLSILRGMDKLLLLKNQ